MTYETVQFEVCLESWDGSRECAAPPAGDCSKQQDRL